MCVFLLACGKGSDNNTDNTSAQIKKLQEQIVALSNNGGENNVAQIAELQKKITELSKSSDTGAGSAAQIAELQKKINELSAKTVDGSVVLRCKCHFSGNYFDVIRTVLGSGSSKAEAKKDAEEVCKTIWNFSVDGTAPAPYVTNCVPE